MASFRSKLARLKPPTLGAPAHVDPPVSASSIASSDLNALRDRIASILARDRTRPLPHEPSASELPFARIDTPKGPLYRRILRYPVTQRIGRFSVIEARTARSEMLALLALDPSLSALNPAEFLYVDTETTGLAGGTGTVAFLLGMARFEDSGELILEQLLLRQLGEEAPLLERFLIEVERATALVSYNGKSFDLPLLRSRLVMNRMPAAPERPHLDLVHVARRVHRSRLKSCPLKGIEEHVLGFLREDDVPSGDVVAHYRQFLRTGDDSALFGVVEHNAWDIVTLAALVGLYGAPMDGLGAEDLVGVSRTLRRAGALAEANEMADRAVDGGAGSEALRERAEVLRARGERDRAVTDLEALLRDVEDPPARLALAKLYEHHVRAHSAALAMANLATTESPDASAKRKARLEKKIARDVQTKLPGVSEQAPLIARKRPSRPKTTGH